MENQPSNEAELAPMPQAEEKASNLPKTEAMLVALKDTIVGLKKTQEDGLQVAQDVPVALTLIINNLGAKIGDFHEIAKEVKANRLQATKLFVCFGIDEADIFL